MAVQVEWWLEGILLYQRFSGSVMIEQLRQANRAIDDLVRQYPPNAVIHLLIDQGDPALALPELHEIVRVSQSFEAMNPGWVALVKSPNLIPQKLGTISMSVLAQLADFHLKSFNTTHEALDFLANADPRIARWYAEAGARGRG